MKIFGVVPQSMKLQVATVRKPNGLKWNTRNLRRNLLESKGDMNKVAKLVHGYSTHALRKVATRTRPFFSSLSASKVNRLNPESLAFYRKTATTALQNAAIKAQRMPEILTDPYGNPYANGRRELVYHRGFIRPEVQFMRKKYPKGTSNENMMKNYHTMKRIPIPPFGF